MQPRPTKLTIKVKGKVHEITTSAIRGQQDSIEKGPSSTNSKGTDQNVVNASSEHSTEDEDAPSCDDSHKQLVLYDPSSNGAAAIEAAQKPVPCQPRSFSRHIFDARRASPEIGAFTVQCAKCFKWRLIPDQEKYEKIREHITVKPFLCETAQEWHRDISCDDPTDIEQDGTRIWAIDKPDIAQPPPGWKRLLRIRSEGSSKFADVYYTAPTGTKLRSIPDVERYLQNHPEHAHGVRIGQFSFQIPKPLRENYVKKRPTPMPPSGAPGSLEPSQAEPIAWAGPEEGSDLQLAEPIAWAGPEETTDGMPGFAPYMKTPERNPVKRAAKKAKIQF